MIDRFFDLLNLDWLLIDSDRAGTEGQIQKTEYFKNILAEKMVIRLNINIGSKITIKPNLPNVQFQYIWLIIGRTDI